MAQATTPRMIVLLGNSGRRYERTRHNAARRLLEVEPFRSRTGIQQKFKAEWARCSVGEHQLIVLIPRTMMNLSGESVQAASRFFRFPAEEIVVAHDETEMDFGLYEVRQGGGTAGHNGLKSVAKCLGSREFWRLRIGVGRPARGDLHGHVLGRFTEEEEAELPAVLAACARTVEEAARAGAFSPTGRRGVGNA